ncbi:GNAT family acetyltransferase [Mycobacterium sp. 852014-52450_SCH5900713]|uniref:GNAT family N-acetyltransferase n=1 Tax=Mycobacterium sp. 852014-52450_SCH5900713 TaxID=1834116 RepID=UPI0007FEAB8E|nr:GNAT family N-acetyltransferase [Mycobacterium sp. 852014-52450_SCH5900713]OBF99715.1 GNAT family acetyltransferase [Mycobacterium sp. 852014-52450_SCH5900713]
MTVGDITIRQAGPADLANVAEMHYPVWRQSWAGILPDATLDVLGSPRRWAVLAYPRILQRRNWSMWVAESGSATIGMTIFGPDPANPEQVELNSLYIAAECQRRGVGERLLATALAESPSVDVVLWCAERNTQARTFYEKNDFHADGRTMDWEPLPGIKVAHLGYRLSRR